MIKDGKNREQVEHEKRLLTKLYERRQWAEYQRTYERCKAIAEAVWKKDLDDASAQQQALAEAMRERTRYDPRALSVTAPAEIHVPLFTPRDRLQFLKEATANLFIGTEQRGLTVTPEVKDVEAKETPAGQGPVEAASGTYEAQSNDAPLINRAGIPASFTLDETQYGEPVSQTPQSPV